MNLLLDTHAFLWFIVNDNRLSARALALAQGLSESLPLLRHDSAFDAYSVQRLC